MSTAQAGSPTSLVYSADGAMLVSLNPDRTVTIWDTHSATVRETLRGHDATQAVFSRDGNTLYTASSEGIAIAWDLTGKGGIKQPFTFTHDRGLGEEYDGHPGRISPDGRLIAVGLKGRGIGLWSTAGLTRAGPPLLETGGEVKALAFSADGRTLAAATANGRVTSWDLESRSPRHEPLFAGGDRVGVAYHSDGKLLATTGSVGGVDFSDAATGASRGTIRQRFPFVPSSDVSFSADGTRVAFAQTTVDRMRAQVWDVAKRSLVGTLETARRDSSAIAVALSPEGRLLAVGGEARVVRLWDVRTREVVREFDAGGANSLEFSPDGRTLAVSGASLWDVATGTKIGPDLTLGSRAEMMDLSSDGRRLLTTLGNGQGAVWDVDPESWARRACALANRTLTRAEWERFLPGRPYEPACAG